MSEQQSQKRGLRSEAQKMEDAREGYEPMGSTSRPDGAFGNQEKERQSDQELALTQEQKRTHEQR
ncbi:MAG TPA: hypothetical protein VF397_08415 [Pyrinomonadaceae bacterium]